MELKMRLLRLLEQADRPLDYRELLEATRRPGQEILDQLQALEASGEVTRTVDAVGFQLAFDPATT